MSPISTKPGKRAKPSRDPFFNESKYSHYLRNYSDVGAVVSKLVPPCDLRVMVKLVGNSFPDRAEQSYEIIRRDRKQIKRNLDSQIFNLRHLAESARRTGQTAEAANFEDGESGFRDGLAQEKRESTKSLGFLKTKLPLAPLYLVCLEEYIASKTGTPPSPKETAHIISALLAGFDQYQEIDVDPDVLAKRCQRFRKRKENRLWIKEIKRLTECDSSGQNELDRRFGTPLSTSH